MVLLVFICWIVISPANSAIQCLNNWGLVRTVGSQLPGPSFSKPDQANPGLVENFSCYFFTAKEGIATKLWPKKVINYFSLNLNLVKNPSLTVNK